MALQTKRSAAGIHLGGTRMPGHSGKLQISGDAANSTALFDEV
jgi:hypothetical protein